MFGAKREVADADHAADDGRSPPLERVPLLLRAVVYYLTFLAFVLILLPFLAYLLAARFVPWQVEIGWGRAAGAAIFAVCWATYTFSSLVLMRRGRGAYVEFDPPTEFVATGPFRWCRNPIAACLLGMLLGEALAFSSVGIFLLLLIAIPLAQLQVVCLEEPLLKKRFGKTYLDYLARVPRWIPRPPREEPS